MIKGKEIELTSNLLGEIDNTGEHIFAEACLLRPHLVITYQIPVGECVIDFRVNNTKRNGSGKGILVEVTESLPKNVNKKNQKEAMRDSGYPFVILNGNNLKNIRNNIESRNRGSG